MRQLERERRGVWFARYAGKEPIIDSDGHRTGEYRIAYDDMKFFTPTVSSRSGNTWGDGFGIGVDCDRTIVLDRIGTGLDETCICWVDKIPATDPDGSISMDEDGQMLIPNDYKVVMVGETFNYTHIAIKKVE